MARLCSCVLLSLLIASSASPITIDWTRIGDLGNACDQQFQHCFGAVGYAYHIGTYEVTNEQYTAFLNAKAKSDPLALYSASMGSGFGGIARSGSSGSWSYAALAGREQMPVNYVSFYDTLRFANWMNNGQGNGDTETGAYTLLGGTPTPTNGTTVTRNAASSILLPTANEWYKAAYYHGTATSYFDYPAASNAETACAAPTTTPNTANCNNAVGDLTIRGGYTSSASPYGTFDQGGNVGEWNETIYEFGRGARGGTFGSIGYLGLAASGGWLGPTAGSGDMGFRLAMIPEPGTGLLVIAALLGLSGWRRACN